MGRPDQYTSRGGEYRQPINIYEIKETADASGSLVAEEIIFAQTRCVMLPNYGREVYDAQRLNPEITGGFEMRWQNGVTPKHKIRMGDRSWDILAAINIEERNRILRLFTRERPGDGV